MVAFFQSLGKTLAAGVALLIVLIVLIVARSASACASHHGVQRLVHHLAEPEEGARAWSRPLPTRKLRLGVLPA
jgi:hypothetical protein